MICPNEVNYHYTKSNSSQVRHLKNILKTHSILILRKCVTWKHMTGTRSAMHVRYSLCKSVIKILKNGCDLTKKRNSSTIPTKSDKMRCRWHGGGHKNWYFKLVWYGWSSTELIIMQTSERSCLHSVQDSVNVKAQAPKLINYLPWK